MSNDKLAEALRLQIKRWRGSWRRDCNNDECAILDSCALEIEGLLQAHAAEAAQAQAQAAKPVEAIGCLSIRHFRGCDSMVNHNFDYFGSLPDGDYRLYTQPQPPAQDAKDAATIERVARAIYEHVFTMSIPRMGVRTATFEEVWAIPSERERLTAQACAAIDAAMAKESGR